MNGRVLLQTCCWLLVCICQWRFGELGKMVLTPGSGCYSLLSVPTVALWVFQSSTASLVVQILLGFFALGQ